MDIITQAANMLNFNIDNAKELLTSILHNFNMRERDVFNIINLVVAISKQCDSTDKKIVENIQEISLIVPKMGISFDVISAFMTPHSSGNIKATPHQTGNSFRKLFDKIDSKQNS